MIFQYSEEKQEVFFDRTTKTLKFKEKSIDNSDKVKILILFGDHKLMW